MNSVATGRAWRALIAYSEKNKSVHMQNLFARDPDRAKRYSALFEDIYLDYSKNRIDDEGMSLLLDLAQECDVAKGIQRMFAGEHINITEDRPVLHTALRNRSDRAVLVDETDVMPAVRKVLSRIEKFSNAVRGGRWQGHTGKAISDVVNIGIGGSHLGPQMVTEALQAYAQSGLRVHFVSNIDGVDISRTLQTVNADTTLFIIASKSFTTQETMTNAHAARDWFLQQGATEADVARHFVAVSTNRNEVARFGIDTDNMFGFWNWVGGRYSLWSAIGLPIVLSVGFARFSELLAGAHAMDEHFRRTPLEQNLPVILALLGVWYINFLGARSHAILPYAEHLRWLPDYLQQADMESNGKQTNLHGSFVDYQTGPVLWGSPGSNGQHAYFQLLHQGTHLVPADFIAVVNPSHDLATHHELLLANCLAQSEALMLGRTLEQTTEQMRADGYDDDTIQRLAPHRVFDGNRPSNTILLRQLEPRSLGSLLALYEHKIFVQGLIWDINSFDQWGVELGKQLASEILPELNEGPAQGRNTSTRLLIEYCRSQTDKKH
ncbi:MAG: glucose-6-phosphate isomerase [Gammaproteobacteria bacterium]|nr:glucose-6-phosphate isomerase [Gammaproteobacteria bacterium]MDH3768373.1 glucose-6-phosphate isomerase [Gammaproteobacteria bacterium]